jgi:hypothetical protein
VLWRHLGEQLHVAAPDLASLRAMYRRGKTLFEHQQLACEALGFRWLSEPQRRALVRALRQELARTRDRQRLLVVARRWLYDHRLIIMHERSLGSTIVDAARQHEATLARSIHAGIDSALLERWRQALETPHEAGLSQQSWLWAAPAKHSPRQIEEQLERIETLYELNEGSQPFTDLAVRHGGITRQCAQRGEQFAIQISPMDHHLIGIVGRTTPQIGDTPHHEQHSVGADQQAVAHRHLIDVPDDLLRRYARRRASRSPSAGRLIREPVRTIEVAYLLRYQRVWQARLDPRRQTPTVGIYSHVRDRWGIFYVQPIVLNERQVGAAIEGVLRQEEIEIAQLAVDTHGRFWNGLCSRTGS